MIKAVIIDDEKQAVLTLESALREFCPQVEIVGTANSAFEGMKIIQTTKPMLVFLDIEMPIMTGIEMIEKISDRQFEVVFVTSYNQYAVRAFKVSAIDYILKPINIIELINAVNKVSERKNIISKSIFSEQDEKLKNIFSGKIGISTLEGTEYVLISDIILFEADGSYTKIYTKDGSKRLVSKNLKHFETILIEDNFYRVHKSFLINIAYIKKYAPSKDGGTIEMVNGSTILVARSTKSLLSDILNKYAK